MIQSVVLNGRLTGKIGVVDGDVAAASIVEDFELCLIGLGNVGKVLVIVGIDVFWVGLAGLVAEMVPFRGRQREFGLLNILGREYLFEVVPLVDIGAADMLDLAYADDGLPGLVTGLGWEGRSAHCDRTLLIQPAGRSH